MQYLRLLSRLLMLVPALAMGQTIDLTSPDTVRYRGPVANVPGAVIGAPFSAREVQERGRTLLNGTHISSPVTSQFVYRDSLGRTRQERFIPLSAHLDDKGEPATVVEITDPVAGYQYVLDTMARIAHRVRLTGKAHSLGPVERPGSPAHDGTASVSLGRKIVNGEVADGIRYTFPGGTTDFGETVSTTTEIWTSTVLWRQVLLIRIDPIGGEFTVRLVGLKHAEPAGDLFTVPQGYQVIDETGPFPVKVTSSSALPPAQ